MIRKDVIALILMDSVSHQLKSWQLLKKKELEGLQKYLHPCHSLGARCL